jgi:UDP-glucose 4-epimerase
VKVLVTGGAGFIGSHVVDALVTAGHRVAIVDNLATGNRAWVNPEARLHVIDLRSARLGQVFEAERPDAVVHVAAQASVPRSVADPAFDASVNIVGGLNLLDCCRRFGVERVVYSSTGGAAYGDTGRIPTAESHPTRPVSPYGVSKIAVEMYLAAWSGLFGTRVIALRYANVYGPRQNHAGEAGVVAIFCHRLLHGLAAVIHGDGAQTRDYVYVEDVAAANLRAIERAHVTGPVNIGTGIETTVNNLYDALIRSAGLDAAAQHDAPRPGEQRRSCLSAKLARRRLGWTPTVPLPEGLRRTFDFFKKEFDREEATP